MASDAPSTPSKTIGNPEQVRAAFQDIALLLRSGKIQEASALLAAIYLYQAIFIRVAHLPTTIVTDPSVSVTSRALPRLQSQRATPWKGR